MPGRISRSTWNGPPRVRYSPWRCTFSQARQDKRASIELLTEGRQARQLRFERPLPWEPSERYGWCLSILRATTTIALASGTWVRRAAGQDSGRTIGTPMDGKLNSAQRQAVETLSGPLLVLAGAGTGKTRVVTVRIARLIQSGIRPSRILAVTFTNKAASEMQQRAAALLGKRLRDKPEISTFHSLCVRMLRRHIRRLGYPSEFAIYDRGDQEGLARAALRELKVGQESLRPGDLLAQISGWKSAAISPATAGSVAASDKQHLAAAAYRRYQRALKAAGAVDFDDLLLLSEQLLREFPEVRRAEAGRFDHLLVDEYQDTNGSQYRIVRALAEGHRNLCVVGDDDQSIYGWRGAEVTHILSFQRDWPDAQVVRLEENYRSRAPIIQAANRLIAFNRQRHAKVLRPFREGGEPPRIQVFGDEIAEAEQVVRDAQSLIAAGKAQPRDVAILCRTNEQPRAFETELRRARLPYVLVGGQSFFDRREIKDIMAYLKLLVRPQEETALLRIINRPARGIGQSTVESLMADAVATGKTVWEILPDAGPRLGLADRAVAAIDAFRRLVDGFRSRVGRGSLATLARELVEAIGYRRELEREVKDPGELMARWNAVEEVVNSLASYESRSPRPDLNEFLNDLALAGRDDGSDKEEQLERNAIVLMTLHSAKGLEFPHVYLVGMEEGILPHQRSLEMADSAIDEERRLCYVGVTRARERLTLSLALTRMKWGKPRGTAPSRFLFELAGEAQHPELELARQRAEAQRRQAPPGAGSSAFGNQRRPVAGKPAGRPSGGAGRPSAAGGGRARPATTGGRGARSGPPRNGPPRRRPGTS